MLNKMTFKEYYLKHKDIFEISRGYLGAFIGTYYFLVPSTLSLSTLFLGTFITNSVVGILIFGE